MPIFNPSYETHMQRYSSLTADQKLHCAGKKGGTHGAWIREEEGLVSPHAQHAAAEVDPELEAIARVRGDGGVSCHRGSVQQGRI